MRREPFPKSWSPLAGFVGTGVDWNNQMTTGRGRPEATQSNCTLSPSLPCTSGGGHWTIALGTIEVGVGRGGRGVACKIS